MEPFSDLFHALRLSRPLGLTMTSIPTGIAGFRKVFVDAAVPMTYYNYASLPNDWTKWINFEKDRHGNRHMYIGPGIYLNSLSNAILELQQTRTASPSGNYAHGFSGYSYRTPYVSGSWAGFSPSLCIQVTPTWADIPDMPWKSSPTKGHISGTVTYRVHRQVGRRSDRQHHRPESRSQLCRWHRVLRFYRSDARHIHRHRQQGRLSRTPFARSR